MQCLKLRPTFCSANKSLKALFNKYVLSSQFLVPRVLQECCCKYCCAFLHNTTPEISPRMLVKSVGRKRRDLHILINQISQDILVFWIPGALAKLNQVRAKGFLQKPSPNPLFSGKVEWRKIRLERNFILF